MSKKHYFILSFLIALAVSIIPVNNAYSKQQPEKDGFYYTYYVKKAQSQDAKELNYFLASYLKALNSHKIDKLKEFYATNYKSGDGFNRDELFNLITQTWQISDDLKYDTDVKNIRMNKNFASIELISKLTGSTNDKSDITGDRGTVKSKSHSILYFQKYGKGWKIISDNILFEKTIIKYGKTKNMNVNLEVPEQVPGGKEYTVALRAKVPENMFALGSITREALIYPRKKSEEIFRQIPGNFNALERVVKANDINQNEMAIASVSLCEVDRGKTTSPDISLVGTAVILKRVNVINNLAFDNKYE